MLFYLNYCVKEITVQTCKAALKKWSITYTEGAPNLSTTPYRVRTVFRSNFYHARDHFARGVPYFFPKILRFPAKKVKSANCTVFKIKTVLAF